jgi:5-bromo-4-chloroindolyl phosphate hydrolysis protein
MGAGQIQPIITLKPDQYINAKTLVNDLDMITHPEYWGVAFKENLKEISEKDYKLIKSNLEKAKNKVIV